MIGQHRFILDFFLQQICVVNMNLFEIFILQLSGYVFKHCISY